ncbi:SpoIIE family protein phosphatase [Dactylosporangium aurantiacum]|uniref:Protein-serine/threonine phosphatase n=1 Tax=Dactylosporangium aurantiacum TaxID=35754 RepID=A0A9Q9IKL9_9ACTN|nr:SpoIIE family protein phosphatase [Dactylosporangium aurantiacum]MDG6108441.1 SpoIIE family protein phosphatase [Dactylosporangium aurantiacum]UWZ57366.1 SpoIIE family protein phosphatase [Dactylosporangium aurantiacum]
MGEVAWSMTDDSEVSRDLGTVDWSATPLGPPADWPQSLRSVVRILLGSRFSMWMAWGPDLTFFCNDAYRRDTLGKKYPWALGKPAREVWAEIWPEIGPRIDAVMATGTATWDEALRLFLGRSGYTEETYHTFSYSPLTDDAGDIAGMLCVVSEDTERVIGERRMATLRDLGADPDGGDQGRVTEQSVFATAARHLGARADDLPFTLTYLFDDDRDTAHLACATGVPAGAPVAPEVLDPEDEPFWPVADLARGAALTLGGYADLPAGAWQEPPTEVRLVPLPAPGGGRPYGFLVVGLNRYRPFDAGYAGFIDLIAGQLAARIGTARAYAAERRRAESLAELDRAKTAFFTNVSHEFRTPLTLLLGPAEDALTDHAAPLPPAQRERVEVVHRNAERLLKLVNTLLDFSQLESGKVEPRFEPLDLAALTAELADMFRPAVQRAGLRLVVDCPPLPRPVLADREMWAKITLNLLSNALKFTFDGSITVRVAADGDTAELSVTDTGVGIDPADQANLFDRFHRIMGTRSRTHEGSGIGLALVAELAALHGGEATVCSAPGAGSTFTVRVPFSGEDQAVPGGDAVEPADRVTAAGRVVPGFLAEVERWITPTSPATPAAPSTAPTVLVVDDNADMREYIRSILEADYQIVEATDGAVALRLLRGTQPDLVLTDVMMPELDGFGLVAALRADGATAQLPVIMLSARAGDEATVEGLEAGADDYLIKPFSPRELRARVRANLEFERVRRTRDELQRSRELLDQAQRLASVGSWELDLATGDIRGSDEFLRQLGVTAEELLDADARAVINQRLHPDDRAHVDAAMAAALDGTPLEYDARVYHPDGSLRTFRTIGELERDAAGTPVRMRGSNQDITEQRRAEQALAAASGLQEAAAREHRIADELQRSLMPPLTFNPEHLEVATYYRPGVAGTQVGGDWYDVIELGADRTALVMGDVMGRGVPAAAVMGQLRAAVRAYARLDLPPADVLEFLDGVVRDLSEDQIVTVVYAVYDPGERSLTYANAGHLPPLLLLPGGTVRPLGVSGPPLGTGPLTLAEERVELPVGALLTLYTDGLVEHRDRDLDTGIDALAAHVGTVSGPLADVPDRLVTALLPDGPDDDITVLLARVVAAPGHEQSVVHHIPAEERAVRSARQFVGTTLRRWDVPGPVVDDLVLVVSELAANAVMHGRPPIQLRLRNGGTHVVLELHDTATYLPRKQRPTPDDEHGRGLQLVSSLCDRWGTRPTADGKAVWCMRLI